MRSLCIVLAALLTTGEVALADDFTYQIILVRSVNTPSSGVNATVYVGNSAGQIYRCAFRFIVNKPNEKSCVQAAGLASPKKSTGDIYLGHGALLNREVGLAWDNFGWVTQRVVGFCYDQTPLGSDGSGLTCEFEVLPEEKKLDQQVPVPPIK